MVEKRIILTETERTKLEKEYRHLIDVKRPDVIEKLQLARSQGDLSENADYDAARDRQAQLPSVSSEFPTVGEFGGAYSFAHPAENSYHCVADQRKQRQEFSMSIDNQSLAHTRWNCKQPHRVSLEIHLV